MYWQEVEWICTPVLKAVQCPAAIVLSVRLSDISGRNKAEMIVVSFAE
jgi:hypothetical protein